MSQIGQDLGVDTSSWPGAPVRWSSWSGVDSLASWWSRVKR
ncbi:hypothetical protein ACFFX0_20980 [Citricoccus parietis]|uniref:Uncharacterized protein n=1 Tax=Citricoccus parietis TaxID=592307 RepID=A0ABV5G3N3_9MICC